MEYAIDVEAVTKGFGKTQALAGVHLAARPGTVMGLLGPNGSGKTTTVRILTTLLRPDSGQARVCGLNVVSEAARVRELIGLTGQYAAVDEELSGALNLELIARLLGYSARDARKRAEELLETFDLVDAGRRLARTYSGGMRRRLDLAASLVGTPQVLFLDEPTTGLDPRSRTAVWDIVRTLRAGGTTILLTTQYLEEADRLADDLVIIDHGKVIASGSSTELKSQVGGQTLEARPAESAFLPEVARILAEVAGTEPATDPDTGLVTVPATDSSILSAASDRLRAAGIVVSTLGLRQPSLDEVFFALTDNQAAQGEAGQETVAAR